MKAVVAVSGSLAFDRIFDYPGRFRDAINPKKLHLLNVSFMVRSVKESYGGTAGNIGYSLALLGAKPMVIGSVGNDFGRYRGWLSRHGVGCSQVLVRRSMTTASAYIITDKDDNQISVFHSGALSSGISATGGTLRQALRSVHYAIIAPDDPVSMVRMSARCRTAGVPYLFDPGQQLTSVTREQLRKMLVHADGVVSNDYELSLLLDRSGMSLTALRATVRYVVTTLGAKGSIVHHGRTSYRIPPVRPKSIIDPTGAGDAYRAGFVRGLLATGSFSIAGRMGSLASAYTVERHGTQTHEYSVTRFIRRYRSSFSTPLSLT